jgi:hypothetical protein
MEVIELKEITVNNFKELLNKKVSISFSDSVKLAAEIVEVTQAKQYLANKRIPFSVVFRTSQKNEYYKQGTYLVSLPELEPLEIFLVPIGFDEIGMKYEAVFS